MFFIRYYNYLCMTIKDLMDTLKKYPPEATVMVGIEHDMCKEAKRIHQATFTFATENGYRYRPVIIE